MGLFILYLLIFIIYMNYILHKYAIIIEIIKIRRLQV